MNLYLLTADHHHGLAKFAKWIHCCLSLSCEIVFACHLESRFVPHPMQLARFIVCRLVPPGLLAFAGYSITGRWKSGLPAGAPAIRLSVILMLVRLVIPSYSLLATAFRFHLPRKRPFLAVRSSAFLFCLDRRREGP